jgi:DNA-binding GntR family transcriptional regulator
MADSAHVAEELLDAWTTKDFERARTLLKDHLHFEGRSTRSTTLTPI